MPFKVAAIVVSHNSEASLGRCLESLLTQDHGLERIVVVDSGSLDRSYLTAYAEEKTQTVQLITTENIGFSRANNLGYESLGADIDFVVFVNPDLFMGPGFIRKALALCAEDRSIGVLSGKLLGYDLEHGRASGRIDSTGILRKWYGRWYDRGQGEHDWRQYEGVQEMPALCGALLFCRGTALKGLQGHVFDPDFFLYKEDIELCLRLGKRGWKLLYHPQLSAYHCRGWLGERSKMSYRLRKLAASSELLLYKKHPSPYMVWALLKYLLVSILHL